MYGECEDRNENSNEFLTNIRAEIVLFDTKKVDKLIQKYDRKKDVFGT